MSFFEEFIEGFTYAFKDKRWISKLWLLILLAVLPFINIISIILFKGWRFETVKRLSKGNHDLPEFDFVLMFKQGLLLWVVMALHIFIPGVLLAVLGMGAVNLVGDAYNIVASGFGSDEITETGTNIGVSFLIYFIWAIISLPVFQSGMIRYSLTDDWKTLFNAPANFLFFVKNIHHFIKFYIYWLMLIGLLFLVDSILAITGVGLLIIPVLSISAYYISSAHELGSLAKRVSKKDSKILQTDLSSSR